MNDAEFDQHHAVRALPHLLTELPAEHIVELVRAERRTPHTAEKWIVQTYTPATPLRQSWRILIRHLVDTPDQQWPEPLRPQ